MSQKNDSIRQEAEKKFIEWAHAFLLCRDEVAAARGIGIPAPQIDQFLQQVKYSEAASDIIASDLVTVPDFSSPEKVKAAVLFQLWREARSGVSGQASARVSALKAISEIAGIVNPESASKMAATGGMLVVPVMSLDDWEKSATRAQQALRASNHE